MLPISSEYYGDNFRWFFGTVIDNTPPYGLEGKIKIHIDGIHSTDTNDIPHKDLPWATVAMPTDTGGGSGHGAIPALTPGSKVFGVFIDGKHSQLPMVLGHIHTTEFPTLVQYRNLLIPEEPLEEAQRSEFAAKYFLNLGYRPHIAATIVGAADQLSSLDPEYEADGRYGLMRWDIESTRYQALINFANAFDPNYGPETFEAQLAFIANELRSTKSRVIGYMRQTFGIDDRENPQYTRSRYVRGLGSASMFVPYFDKNYQQTIIEENLESIKTKSKDILNKLVI